ncbi:vitellogenin receptor-like [Saccostrea echinata]|uniref:vitellogenin receptor-like n=1 Tax=Saccostrea echinata TaxID=191078 RepID=UPI002A831A28|nr:vitellogenin receptor-like [Saccostrea echinata]
MALTILHSVITTSIAADCPAGEVPCLDGVGCVSRIKICDGISQCLDQSDELFCLKSKADDPLCDENQFVCFNGENCISRTLVCDDAHDCSDRSDEDICDPHEQCKKEGLYLCRNNQQCLNTSRLCDGKPDCRDATDEGGQCEEARTECDSGKCHHICVTSPTGATCKCNPGFHKLKNHTCIDTDECEDNEPPLCSHVCRNTPGGYACSCYHGYRLTDEGKCRVEGSPPVFLLAHDGEIRGYEVFQNRSLPVLTEDAKLYAKDQDDIKSMALGPNQVLYFSDTGHQKIYSSDLNGDWKAHKHEVINMGLKNPEGIEVDWTTGHLYVADSGRGEILACLGDGEMCTSVVSYIHHPKALVIDQKNRQLYWSDVEDPPKIKRANLDGSGTVTFLSDHVGYASVMILDYISERLFWVDKLSPKLESVHLDGSNRQILPVYNLRNPVSIAVFEDRIYWTDLGWRALFSANKFTGHDIQHEISGLQGHAVILVMHPALQNSNLIRDTCSGIKCSHMCLPTSDGHRCMCPQDMHLESNNITCQISLDVPRIYLGAKKEILQFPLSSVGYQDSQVRTVIGGDINTVPAMSICPKHQVLVYSDITRDVIASINISVDSGFSRESIIYSKHLQAVEKLEVDPVTGNIFWIDVGEKTVEVASLSGKYRKALLSSDQIIQRPTSIAIDSSQGILYLSLVGVSPSILQCSLDGTFCKPLPVEVHHPNDLLLYEGHLYIADDVGGVARIISVKLTNRGAVHWQTYLVQGNGKAIKRMAIYDKILYWVEDKATSVFSLNLQNIEEESSVLHNTIPLSSIIVSTVSKIAETACSINNGGCSHLCIPVSIKSRVCKCSDGFFLQKDNTSCARCKEPSCHCEIHRNCSNTLECGGLLCDIDLCVPLDIVCDGTNDCVDMSDEDGAHCSQTTPKDCGPGHFACTSGECISGHLVCNGHPDCPDASDEGHQCHQDLPERVCPTGYEFQKDKKSCQDVNECKDDNGGCSQVCVNTEGGRSCHCSPEFISNTTSCIPPDPRPYFLFLEHTTLTRYDLDQQGEFITICAAEPFLTFDVIMSTGDILGISSADSKTLLRTNQSDQKKEVLLSMLGKVAYVAYDWLGNNLYISDILKPALIVCPVKLLKEGCLSLLHETTGSVALYPVKGLMFWLNRDSIQKSTMLGVQRRSVVEFEFVSVRSCLVLDQFSDRLYWIDHVQHAIESCSTDGSYRRTILSQGLYKFLSINVFGDDLYFTDEASKSLYKYNRITGHTTMLTNDLPFSSQLKVIHPILQNADSRSDVCAKRFCSHLCLPTPEGAVCACPDGWDLINNRTCRSPHVVPLVSTKTQVGISKSPFLPRVTSTHGDYPTTSAPRVTSMSIITRKVTSKPFPPKVEPTPIPPKLDPTPTRSMMDQTASSTKVSLSPLSAAPCNLLCMNGGTCSYSKDKDIDYCVCRPGYTGFFCNEEEPGEEAITPKPPREEAINPRPPQDNPSVIVGVILGSLFTAVVIISCLCYVQHKRDKVPIAEIIHFRPLLSNRHSEDNEELFSEHPARTNPQNNDQSHDYEEVSPSLSSDIMEDHGELRWQHSTTSVDSAFVSHSDENDPLTSQLIPV